METSIRQDPLDPFRHDDWAKWTGLIRKKRENRSEGRGSAQEAGASKEEGNRITRWCRGAMDREDDTCGQRNRPGGIEVGRQGRRDERRLLIKRFRGPGRCDDRPGYLPPRLLGTTARARHGSDAGCAIGCATGHRHIGPRRHAERRHAAQRDEEAQGKDRHRLSRVHHTDNIQKIGSPDKSGNQ